MTNITDNRGSVDPKRIVLITGGFDPIHSGHIQYMKAASKLGNILIVGVNSDEWLTRKKGRPFMPLEERMSLLRELYVVDKVIEFDDSDDTACNAIELIKERYKDTFNDSFHKKIIFCNGGDRTEDNIPEMEKFKNEDWIQFEFGVGGDYKRNSSSWILEDYRNAKTERDWGYYRVVHTIGKGIKVKELVIEPGKELSNQKHSKRSEMWYIMKGQCIVNGETRRAHEPGFTISPEQWHKAENPFLKPCHILECQFGEECIESDIERAPFKPVDIPWDPKKNKEKHGMYIHLRHQEDDGYCD